MARVALIADELGQGVAQVLGNTLSMLKKVIHQRCSKLRDLASFEVVEVERDEFCKAGYRYHLRMVRWKLESWVSRSDFVLAHENVQHLLGQMDPIDPRCSNLMGVSREHGEHNGTVTCKGKTVVWIFYNG